MQIVAERYALQDIHDPVAFVRKNVDHGNQDGFTRVVIFLEKKQGGHFGSKERFHAVQVSSWTLKYKKRICLHSK